MINGISALEKSACNGKSLSFGRVTRNSMDPIQSQIEFPNMYDIGEQRKRNGKPASKIMFPLA